jgi:hypothetical protein
MSDLYNVLCVTKRFETEFTSKEFDSRPKLWHDNVQGEALVDGLYVTFNGVISKLHGTRVSGNGIVLQIIRDTQKPFTFWELYTDSTVEKDGTSPETLREWAKQAIARQHYC